jgi:hypothetical protein
MDGAFMSFMIFWSVVGTAVLAMLAARRFRRRIP